MKKRRGVSPILGIIILIGIALVGGAFLNGISQNFFASSMSTVKYSINDLRIEKDSNEVCFLGISLYNSGTLPIKKTTVKTTLDNGKDWAHSDLNGTTILIEPKGQLEKTIRFDGNNCGNFTVGNSYSLFINGTSGDSSFASIIPVEVTRVRGS
ncbi:MAG: hypothetical protein GWN01_03620 [Nitrosopumilaceae archaeon]|nr:hypothetical protein [Nitrosopumilaceae archaeon]NIU00047.1 hypothetical protein [Nitrosopumilaceae archaeon]NIU86426.1 hypothetical protein [Nitrosopumilaceae archaeon]NIV65135.1 hypothetical protein [Nitrosopumilaceae archaeon]NIX60649.1 hypothetical protein [Nitrosopumilaceae archaeon]